MSIAEENQEIIAMQASKEDSPQNLSKLIKEETKEEAKQAYSVRKIKERSSFAPSPMPLSQPSFVPDSIAHSVERNFEPDSIPQSVERSKENISIPDERAENEIIKFIAQDSESSAKDDSQKKWIALRQVNLDIKGYDSSAKKSKKSSEPIEGIPDAKTDDGQEPSVQEQARQAISATPQPAA